MGPGVGTGSGKGSSLFSRAEVGSLCLPLPPQRRALHLRLRLLTLGDLTEQDKFVGSIRASSLCADSPASRSTNCFLPPPSPMRIFNGPTRPRLLPGCFMLHCSPLQEPPLASHWSHKTPVHVAFGHRSSKQDRPVHNFQEAFDSESPNLFFPSSTGSGGPHRRPPGPTGLRKNQHCPERLPRLLGERSRAGALGV